MEITESIISGLILLIIGGLGTACWTYRKQLYNWLRARKLQWFPANFNIALSIEFDEGLNSGSYFKQIKKNINQVLKEQDLDKYVVVQDFSDIKKFKNQEEAEKFRNKKDIDLIIWGDFTVDNLKKDGNNINKLNLSFTFGHPDDKEKRIGKMILADLRSRMARKNYWNIIEHNSFEDIQIVSNNIFDLSIYTIALSLKIYGKIGKSIALLERLYNSLAKRNDDLIQSTAIHLIDDYTILVVEFGLNKKDFNKGIEFCNKILKLDVNNHFALTNLATFLYKQGKIAEAQKVVTELQQKYPSSTLTIVDLAFFKILEKNYKSAFKCYEKLVSIPVERLGFNPLEVVEFLNNEYQKNKEPALLYGSGILSYYFGDKIIAKNDLKLFLRKVNENSYKKMYRKAKKLI
ncbi:hypothetical protein KKC88_02595 [Patescibacteria group bacterium]|nr:hypothetical protein [Patescibacteria group bacterium]MBU1672859.1 hypothetical protein [Patescibacteria group bacterium]MBU1901588.1 hypothetical protein [Patescibacteria group bacterium]